MSKTNTNNGFFTKNELAAERGEKNIPYGFSSSKPHYEILDGLRGVAALMVMWFHIFEAFATSAFDQKFNHGYLAVDFFFILSGFVVGYAYDDRWQKGMSVKDFFKRRVIRLHPMVVFGMIFGAVSFCIQGRETWAGETVPLSTVLLSAALGLFLIPAIPGTAPEVRGNGEMFPLNGPSWSLFFEYLGNVLYALFIRRLPTKILAVVVALCGIGLAVFAIGNFSGSGSVGAGWSLSGSNFPGGILRLLFSFSAGLLMSRIFKPIKIRGAFWICAAAVVVLLSVPHVGGEKFICLNGIYDSVCVLLAFPLLVFIGASGQVAGKISSRVCKFLGDISYPVYIVHYPLMYLFYAYVWKNELTFPQAWQIALSVYFGSILLAWLCLKFYDEPLRRFLSRK